LQRSQNGEQKTAIKHGQDEAKRLEVENAELQKTVLELQVQNRVLTG
jgi:hypothetical protein